MGKKKKGGLEQQPVPINQHGFPDYVRTGRGYADFQFLAPINGSAIYGGVTHDGIAFHAVIPHPDGWEKQLRYLARGG